MVFSFSSSGEACENHNLKDLCFQQGAQNRRVCAQPTSGCSSWLSFISDFLGRLIGQMWTCKTDCCYRSWLRAKYFPGGIYYVWVKKMGKKWPHVHFPLPLFLVENKFTRYSFDLLSCAWGVSPGVGKSWLFVLPWTFSKDWGYTVWKICHSTSEVRYFFLKYFSLLGSCH